MRPRRSGRVAFRAMPAARAAPRRAHQGRQHPLPRRRGRRVRLQVGDRLRRHRPGAGARQARQGARRLARRAVRRRARDRRRHRLLLAQPAPARADRARDRDRHLAGMLDALRGDRRERSALEVETVARRRRAAAVRRRELRPRLRPRRPAPHPRPRAAPSRSSRACCAPAGRSPSAASPRATATGSRRCRSAAASSSAPLWRRAVGAAERAAAERATARDGHELEREVDVHAFAPGELRRAARATPASSDVADPRRGAARQRLRLDAALARGDRRARAVPWRWQQLRLPQLPRAAARRRRAARAAPAARSSSTTSCSRRASPARRA